MKYWNADLKRMLFIYLISVKRNFTLFELNAPCFEGAAAAFAAVVFLMPSVPETVHNRLFF